MKKYIKDALAALGYTQINDCLILNDEMAVSKPHGKWIPRPTEDAIIGMLLKEYKKVSGYEWYHVFAELFNRTELHDTIGGVIKVLTQMILEETREAR